MDSKIHTLNYDFLDFGCKEGRSLRIFGELFDAKGKGLGLDLNKKNVAKTIANGFDAQLCDVRNIEVESKVRFCVMNHFLEHIPNFRDVGDIIKKACEISSEFVFIKQPYFDADPYLFSLGFKFFYSTWKAHPNHMTLLEFTNVLNPLVSEGVIKSYTLYGHNLVTNSKDWGIHNLEAQNNVGKWDKNIHSIKDHVTFDQPVFRQTIAVLDIGGDSTDYVEGQFVPDQILYCSDTRSSKR